MFVSICTYDVVRWGPNGEVYGQSH